MAIRSLCHAVTSEEEEEEEEEEEDESSDLDGIVFSVVRIIVQVFKREGI